MADHVTTEQAILQLADLIQISEFGPRPPGMINESIDLRAIAPEPQLEVIPAHTGAVRLTINNIAQDAQLEISGDPQANVHETVDGITRYLDIQHGGSSSLTLTWRLRSLDGFRFAVIGDTGGGLELGWSIRRAQELGALFLLHLGDFNYNEGEYESAIRQFYDAPLPVYISIGNHDFHDDGLIYHQFLRQIGPMNHTFVLADTRFVNIDSAADFFPANSGNRGRLMQQLLESDRVFSGQVFFTHRPFKDPRPGEDHVIGGVGEIDWLCGLIRKIGCQNILTGHVHHSTELDYRGLRQWTVGEGTGHEDLVHQTQVARLLLGSAQKGRPIEYQWQALNLPWEMHTSPTHIKKLKINRRHEQLAWFESMMRTHRLPSPVGKRPLI